MIRSNDQSIYDSYARAVWDSPEKFQRLLASQVIPRMKFFDTVVPDWSGLEVLDLGCGPGFMSEALAKRGANVIGIDPCAAALEAATGHALTQGLAIKYLEGAGESIPLDPASVDCVVCVDVLEHVESVSKVIAECRRVLRPGGYFLFDTINRNGLASFMVVTMMEDVFRTLPRGSHDPSKFIRPDELSSQLRRSGFEDVGNFTGMGIVRIQRNLDFKLGLIRSTKVMYIGYAR